jgi:hypothetical protein
MDHLATGRLGFAQHLRYFGIVVVEHVVQKQCGSFFGAKALESGKKSERYLIRER